ncbi:MAG: hypothetical protein E6Q78_10030 [Rhodoferax sp.]|nr:MAG: hypothetical protein E6Q78_10030 [Rhodoferax sp.]
MLLKAVKYSILIGFFVLTNKCALADARFTQAAKTAEGCIFYIYPDYEVTSASWKGKCTPEKEISGNGELKFEARLTDPKEGFLGKREFLMTGQFKRGLMDGKGTQTRVYYDKDGKKTQKQHDVGTFSSGLNGAGERLTETFEINSGKLMSKEQIAGNFSDGALHGQGRITLNRRGGYSDGYIEEGLFEQGKSKLTDTRFLNTILGGDVVLKRISYDTKTGEPTSQEGAPKPDNLVGYVDRPKGKLHIVLMRRNLTSSFLKEFALVRRNWVVECVQPDHNGRGDAISCVVGKVEVKDPEFRYQGSIALNLDDLDNERHPAPELQYHVDMAALTEKSKQAANEEKAKELAKLGEQFKACIQRSRRLDESERQLNRELDDLRNRESNLGMLGSLIDGAQSIGANADVDGYNRRARELRADIKRHDEKRKALSSKYRDLEDSCPTKVPTSMVEQYCGGDETLYCKGFR